MPSIRMSAALVKVLEVLLEDPQAERYGLDIMRATGCPSGTVYPILLRLHGTGWLEAHWEDIDPAAVGRPARRWYRLTPHGTASARADLAAYRERQARARSGVTKPRPTWAS